MSPSFDSEKVYIEKETKFDRFHTFRNNKEKFQISSCWQNELVKFERWKHGRMNKISLFKLYKYQRIRHGKKCLKHVVMSSVFHSYRLD